MGKLKMGNTAVVVRTSAFQGFPTFSNFFFVEKSEVFIMICLHSVYICANIGAFRTWICEGWCSPSNVGTVDE